MKIYDCFQFFDENMLLDLRLNILDQYVDKFVIVENSFMHSGKKKSLNFDAKKFKKFEKKINYIVIENLPDTLFDISKQPQEERGNRIIDNTLMIEHNQRNSIVKGIEDADQNDLILISDVDEIPNLKNIELEIKKKLIFFKQQMYYYKFNLKYSSKNWIGTKGCLKKNLQSPQWIRDVKDRKYPYWRLDTLFSNKKYQSIQFIENGGWHFTNIKTPKELEVKFKNFGHNWEFNNSGINLQDIENMVKNNIALYDYQADMRESKWSGSKKLSLVEDNELPEYIISNKHKLSQWFQ